MGLRHRAVGSSRAWSASARRICVDRADHRRPGAGPLRRAHPRSSRRAQPHRHGACDRVVQHGRARRRPRHRRDDSDSMRWIPKGMTVRYLKKATGPMTATARVPALAASGGAANSMCGWRFAIAATRSCSMPTSRCGSRRARCSAAATYFAPSTDFACAAGVGCAIESRIACVFSRRPGSIVSARS